jgi:hypothetical protein
MRNTLLLNCNLQWGPDLVWFVALQNRVLSSPKYVRSQFRHYSHVVAGSAGLDGEIQGRYGGRIPQAHLEDDTSHIF